MRLTDLIALLHYEVQTSYDFVHEVTRAEGKAMDATLHIALESVELELPISGSLVEMHEPLPSEDAGPFERLRLPFNQLTAVDRNARSKEAGGGMVMDVEVVNALNKIGDKNAAEAMGRLRISLKPILK